MTKQETMKILSVLKVAYPHSYQKQSKEEAVMMVQLWTEMFAEIPYRDVDRAVRSFIATDQSGYAPTIGQINAELHSGDKTMSPQEASALVAKAASRSAWHAEEEFAKLPPEIQQVVRSPEMLRAWAGMDAETFNSVILSNFQRSYKAAMEDTKKSKMLPASVRNVIDFGEMLKLKEG